VYTVSLTAQVAGASAVLPGGTDTRERTHYITVTESPPQVDFVGNPRSGDAPLTVQFTSTVTGTVTDYQWNFGHGGFADTPNPTHTYPHAGSFGVTLVVTGPGGTTDISKPGYISVNAAPGAPTATFSADVVSGTAPLTVTFTAVTSGTVEHWLWSFGDGGTAFTGPVVSHTYVTSDTFDVSLTVSNTHGSFIVSNPAYITVRTKDDDSHFIYLPLILRNAP
jgi:PKD repeat protein